jgi:hypothetical protein
VTTREVRSPRSNTTLFEKKMKRTISDVEANKMWLPDDVWRVVISHVNHTDPAVAMVVLSLCKKMAYMITPRIRAWLLCLLKPLAERHITPHHRIIGRKFQPSGDTNKDLICLFEAFIVIHNLEHDRIHSLYQNMYYTVAFYEPEPGVKIHVQSFDEIAAQSQVLTLFHIALLNSERYPVKGDVVGAMRGRKWTKKCVSWDHGLRFCDDLGDIFYCPSLGDGNHPAVITSKNLVCLSRDPRIALIEWPPDFMAKAHEAVKQITDIEQRVHYDELLKRYEKQKRMEQCVALKYTILRKSMGVTNSRHRCRSDTKLCDVALRLDADTSVHVLLEPRRLPYIMCKGDQSLNEKKRIIMIDNFFFFKNNRAVALFHKCRHALLVEPLAVSVIKERRGRGRPTIFIDLV